MPLGTAQQQFISNRFTRFKPSASLPLDHTSSCAKAYALRSTLLCNKGSSTYQVRGIRQFLSLNFNIDVTPKGLSDWESFINIRHTWFDTRHLLFLKQAARHVPRKFHSDFYPVQPWNTESGIPTKQAASLFSLPGRVKLRMDDYLRPISTLYAQAKYLRWQATNNCSDSTQCRPH